VHFAAIKGPLHEERILAILSAANMHVLSSKNRAAVSVHGSLESLCMRMNCMRFYGQRLPLQGKLSPKVTEEEVTPLSIKETASPHPALRATFPRGGRLCQEAKRQG